MANKKLVIVSTTHRYIHGPDLIGTSLTAPSIKAGLEKIVQLYRPLFYRKKGYSSIVEFMDDVEISVYEGRKLTNKVSLHIYKDFSTYHLTSVNYPDISKHYELDGKITN